jgi:hypothetical protein
LNTQSLTPVGWAIKLGGVVFWCGRGGFAMPSKSLRSIVNHQINSMKLDRRDALPAVRFIDRIKRNNQYSSNCKIYRGNRKTLRCLLILTGSQQGVGFTKSGRSVPKAVASGGSQKPLNDRIGFFFEESRADMIRTCGLLLPKIAESKTPNAVEWKKQ